MRNLISRALVALGIASLLLPLLAVGGVLAQPPADENHFRCYIVSQQTPQPAETVTVEDQFTDGPATVTVGEPVYVCAPTEKTIGGNVTEIENEEQHYALYTAPAEANPRSILVTDQFRTDAVWRVTTPKYIMVPTAKTVGGVTFDDVNDSQHYWCYEANGPRVGVRATLEDQFSGPDNVRITTPTLFCNPAEKVHNGTTFEMEDDELHYACYEIHGKQKTQQFTIGAENQFEDDTWQTGPWEIICAPAEKTLPN